MKTSARIVGGLLVSTLLGCGSSVATAPAHATSVSPPQVVATVSDGPPHDPEIHAAVSGPLLPPMLLAVTSFAAARDDKFLYVIGGYAGTPHDYSREGQSRAVWRLALNGSEPWTEITHMTEGAQGLSAAAYKGRVCRFGGNVILNAREEETRMASSTEAACFDTATQTWSALPPLPAGRSSHESTLIGSTVYVVGGWQLQGDAGSGTFHGDMLALDLDAAAPSWRSIATPFQRRAIGVTQADGKLYVIGGLTADNQLSQRVDVFDPTTQTWSQGPDYPSNAFGLAATTDGSRIYASARDGVVNRLQPGHAAWTPVSALMFPRFFHQLVAHEGHVIAFGGISGMHTHGRTRHVERVPVEPAGPSVATIAIDYPGAAKNRQAMFVHDDFLYLFGGNNSLGQHDFEPNNFVAEGWRLHLPSLRWERIADYPAARQTMQSVVIGERAYAIGGFGHNGQVAITHPDAYAFSFATQQWSALPGLDRGRTQFGLTVHGNDLWIFGGLNYDPDRPDAFDHVLNVLKAPADGPFTITNVTLPAERRAFASVTVGDRYFMLGGMKDNFAAVTDCATFDYTTQKFAAFPCPQRARVSGDAVAIDNHLYVAGGMARTQGGLEPERSIETLDLAAAQPQWETLIETLPFDTRHIRALKHGERILLVSTHNEDHRLQLAWVTP